MRLRSIKVRDFAPIDAFEVDDLSDLVVIAGANGAGKTRLVKRVLSALQNPRDPNVEFVIESTSDEERSAFSKDRLVTSDPGDAILFQQFIQQNRLRRNFKSGIVYFESDRSIAQIKPLAFAFDYADPYTENIGWNIPMEPFKNRWQDTQHAIFKKIVTLRNQLGGQALNLRREGRDQMNLGFSDPIQPFKDAFQKLLAPKALIDPDLQNQKLMYVEGGQERPVDTLSSGEREVLNIAFDFILRKPSDCVVFLDEPELHLHPELLRRLIKTLTSSGERNQFVLISHSPEVVASSLEDTVIFLAKAKGDGANQATVLKPGGETTEALRALGQSVGVIALGKKVVLIEGREASLDTQVYSTICQDRFTDLVLAPADGKADLENFDRLNSGVLEKTLWGVQFFMLADRDCVIAGNVESDKFRILPRYHLENYLLDSEVLSECFRQLEPAGSWLRAPTQIESKLIEIAKSKVSYAASLIASSRLRRDAGNVSLMPKGAHGLSKDELIAKVKLRSSEEVNRVNTILDSARVEKTFSDAYDQIREQVQSGVNWKIDVPGKPIFSQFCGEANIQIGRLKNIYISKALEIKPAIFDEIMIIFKEFSDF